jgi:hypothetical protein
VSALLRVAAFRECDACASKPGSPTLCGPCLERRALIDIVNAPTPMLLACPMCQKRHIDVGTFATKPHHTHACQRCGHCWRPAIVATVGVRFLPGFKDQEAT